MIRVSLLIASALLLYGCAAKPRSGKRGEERFQDTVKPEELSGKMSLGLKEVEPPEDMAVTDDDIDPDMAIWKVAQWSRGRKHLVPEVDLDDLDHPPLGPVPEAPASQYAAFQNDLPKQPYRQAEPDLDDQFHGFPGPEVMDEPYHRYKPDQRPGQEPQVGQEQPRSMTYTQPEEDHDEEYHRDVPAQHIHPLPQVQPEPRSRMTYSQPEEDRDHLYHN